MKMLLKFCEPTFKQIILMTSILKYISALDLRGNCGVVMQDCLIFSDTIERNIAMSDGEID